MPGMHSERIHSFDVARLYMSFLVVTAHFPFEHVGNYFYAFSKVAVPVFFIFSGYLLYRSNEEEMLTRMVSQTKRILSLIIISNVLYGIVCFLLEGKDQFIAHYFTTEKMKDFILYNVSPFSEHLWFLGSMFYALIILILFVKLKLLNAAMYSSLLLILIYYLLTYFGPPEPFAYRNAILTALPYMMIGMFAKRYEDKLIRINGKVLLGLTAFFGAGTIAEMFINPRGVKYPYITTGFLIFAIAFLCMKYKHFGANTISEVLGRECSLFIYIEHIMVGFFLNMLISEQSFFMSDIAPITVFVITLVVAIIYKKIISLITKKPFLNIV